MKSPKVFEAIEWLHSFHLRKAAYKAKNGLIKDSEVRHGTIDLSFRAS
jgi:hypothetical protein